MDIPMSGTRLADWNAFGDWVWASVQGLAGITPIATLAVVVVAYMTYRQRSYADLRAHDQKTAADNQIAWWARTQWAIEASLDSNPIRNMMGTAALKEMQKSELATDADQRLLKSLADSTQFEAMQGDLLPDREPTHARSGLDRDSKVGENEGNEGGPGTDDRHHQ